MTRIATIIICIILLSSCDRKDYIVDLNTAPIITVVGNVNSSISDSVKISSSSIYQLDIELQDKDANLSKLEFSILGGSGYFINTNGDKITEINDINIGNHTLRYNTTNDLNSQNFTIKAEDNFGLSNILSINLLVFDNLPPVANAVSNNIAIADPNEYKIDASTSYDQDQAFGGNIVKYKFTINGNPIQTTVSFINYIFPSSGNYDIGVQVQDNDGTWSSVYSFVISI